MNKHTRELAEKAGFIFWRDEHWGPNKKNAIDWGNEYDTEFEKFVKLLTKELKHENPRNP